ncbi:unnamed protein product [Symbiodinium microadriaticum]|nr:unnamed protein product [Symbiodinium microadriaticum]
MTSLLVADVKEVRRKRILKTRWVKTHWDAQTHCEDASDGADALRRRIGWRRRMAKTRWIGADALRRRIGAVKMASEDTFEATAQEGADTLRSRFHDIAATSRMRGQVHMHDLARDLMLKSWAIHQSKAPSWDIQDLLQKHYEKTQIHAVVVLCYRQDGRSWYNLVSKDGSVMSYAKNHPVPVIEAGLKPGFYTLYSPADLHMSADKFCLRGPGLLVCKFQSFVPGIDPEKSTKASADPATAGMSADACLAVPKDAAEAVEAAQASRIAAGSAAGEEELGDAWRAELNWRTAELPRWRPALEEDLEVRNSTLPGAGRGLFAARALPKGTVLPPYGGQQLTYREVGLREFSEGMTYTWCPLRNGAAMLEMSPQELIEGPRAQQLAYCVDSRIASEGNPARFVNGASSSDQCENVRAGAGRVLPHDPARSCRN